MVRSCPSSAGVRRAAIAANQMSTVTLGHEERRGDGGGSREADRPDLRPAACRSRAYALQCGRAQLDDLRPCRSGPGDHGERRDCSSVPGFSRSPHAGSRWRSLPPCNISCSVVRPDPACGSTSSGGRGSRVHRLRRGLRSGALVHHHRRRPSGDGADEPGRRAGHEQRAARRRDRPRPARGHAADSGDEGRRKATTQTTAKPRCASLERSGRGLRTSID